jgi:hypothetical protein
MHLPIRCVIVTFSPDERFRRSRYSRASVASRVSFP